MAIGDVKYRKVGKGRYFGRCGKYYVFIYIREHGKWDGFEKYCKWYTARVGKGGEWLRGEGQFTSYLSTLKKAKDWAKQSLLSLVEAEGFKAEECLILKKI